jgi:hypothetical protein
LIAVFGSGFFVVTVVFDCADTVLSVTFAVALAGTGVAALLPAARVLLAAAFGSVLLDVFSVTPRGVATFAFPAGLGAAAVFASDFAVVFDAAGFAFLEGSVRFFAGFFIALAIESTTYNIALAKKRAELLARCSTTNAPQRIIYKFPCKPTIPI